jgi:hypothetical protein
VEVKDMEEAEDGGDEDPTSPTSVEMDGEAIATLEEG